MTDFPEGVEKQTVTGPFTCEQCGRQAKEPCGDFETPPAGWMAIKANYFDGQWPGIQPISSRGDNTIPFCCPACASAWIMRWGNACADGYAPKAEPNPSPNDPPRYLGLRTRS